MFTNNTLSLVTAPPSDSTAPVTPVASSDPTAPAPKRIPSQSTVKYHYFI